MHVQRSTEIAAPPARIWPLLAEPEDVMRWYQVLRIFRYEEGTRGKGAHIYAEEQGAGLVKLDFVVTEWTVERAIALHMTRGPAWSATNSAGPSSQRRKGHASRSARTLNCRMACSAGSSADSSSASPTVTWRRCWPS